MHKKSIVYVNFSPYENAGNILDYIKENFSLIVLFSFKFHKLGEKSELSELIVFKNGGIIDTKPLYYTPTPESLAFLLLPIRSFVIFLQICWHLYFLKHEYGTFDIYFTVNAFTAWVGNVARSLGIVKKTIFWVWDYYPPGHPDWRIRLARWLYWIFDKQVSKTNKNIFLNKKLVELRQSIGVLSKNKKYTVVPIGTNPHLGKQSHQKIVGHLGVLKKGQGLDLLFDNLKAIMKLFPSIKIEIIGAGPDIEYFKNRAAKFKNVTFYGFVKDDQQVNQIINLWSVGIATYIPNKSNESAWTDPSKIKAYLSHGVPVITTNVTDFSQEVKRGKAGVVINYENEEFIAAIIEVMKNQLVFKKSAYKLAKKYYYRKIYKKIFD